jgi:hypothetical protein
MTERSIRALLGAACLTALACGSPERPPILSDPSPESVASIADYVRPTSAESAWRDIPWQPTFAGGLRAAVEDGRPLLFWAMNGHPLGCT